MTGNWKISIQSKLEWKNESGDFKECYSRKKMKFDCTEKNLHLID